MAGAGGGPAADGCGGAAAGLDHAAHERPLPAAGHHCLEPGAVLHDGQPGRAGQVRRPAGRAGDRGRRLQLPGRAAHRLADLDCGAGLGGGGDAPAGQPARPRDARAEPQPRRRHDDARGDGRVNLPLQGGDVPHRGAAGVAVGVALRAHAAQRQPQPLRHQVRHRVPLHGGARRRRQRVGGLHRCGAGQADRRSVAGLAAAAAGHRGQL